MFLDIAQAADSAEPAAWLVEVMTTFAADVTSIVPAGFERYARILHPATTDADSRQVRWSAVAAANGRVAHGAMQWQGITGRLSRETCQSGVWDNEPQEGSLPASIGSILAETLAEHTTTADHCWFGVWEGFGALPDEARTAPCFEIPARRFHLFRGPLTAILESVENHPWLQSPNIWWPQDRSWCVATEIDFMSTYLAGSRSCVQDVLNRADLEAYEVAPTDGISIDGDVINPLPDHP